MRRANLVHKWDTAIHTCKTELFQTEQEKKKYTTPNAQINLFGALKKQSLINPSDVKKQAAKEKKMHKQKAQGKQKNNSFFLFSKIF